MNQSFVPTRPHSHPVHRGDIDGLRAVAILSVLVFHAWPESLPGGFVGVDVFFVISGYLISGIIFKGLLRNSFSFFDFYVRRIKRIFPALALVLCFVWLAGWLSTLSDEFAQLGKHIAAGAGFVSNFAFWKEAGYFDRDAALKPLLHLWSLGIEEQFYIGWPLLVFLGWKRKFNLLAIIVAVGTASFILNVSRIATHEAATFYLPVTRIWELSIGCMLAYWQVFEPPELSDKYAALKNAIAALGALLLIVAVVFIDPYKLFPGWWALLPTVGTFCLIAAGKQAWINHRILGSPPMVFIGLISYPLYLWHWPLLSFQRIIEPDEPTNIAKILTLALAFALAWLTYRFVETPIRSNESSGRLIAAALVTGVAGIGLIGYLSLSAVIQPRSANYGLDKIIAASTGVAFSGPRLRRMSENPNLLSTQGGNVNTVLFIGDSHIEQYYPRIDRLLTGNPGSTRGVVFVSSGGCPPMPQVKDDHHRYCDGLVELAMAYAAKPNVDTVVIGANWMRYFRLGAANQYYFEDGEGKRALNGGPQTADRAFAALQAMIGQFSKNGKKVFIVLQSPVGDVFDPRQMIDRNVMHLSFTVRVPTVARSDLLASMSSVVVKLREIAAATGAQVIDPIDWLCATQICPMMTAAGDPIYKDEHTSIQSTSGNMCYIWMRC